MVAGSVTGFEIGREYHLPSTREALADWVFVGVQWSGRGCIRADARRKPNQFDLRSNVLPFQAWKGGRGVVRRTWRCDPASQVMALPRPPRPKFFRAPAPMQEQVAALVERVAVRVRRLVGPPDPDAELVSQAPALKIFGAEPEESAPPRLAGLPLAGWAGFAPITPRNPTMPSPPAQQHFPLPPFRMCFHPTRIGGWA